MKKHIANIIRAIIIVILLIYSLAQKDESDNQRAIAEAA
jgi:hypothetical protein